MARAIVATFSSSALGRRVASFCSGVTLTDFRQL